MNLICLEVILLYLLAASCLGAVELYIASTLSSDSGSQRAGGESLLIVVNND